MEKKAYKEEAGQQDIREREMLKKNLDRVAERHEELRRMKQVEHDQKVQIKKLQTEIKLKRHGDDKETYYNDRIE